MSNKIENLLKYLRPGQKIEIDSVGNVIISWRDNNQKRHTLKQGNYYEIVDEIVPLMGKSWVSINSPAIKSYHDFGKKLPKHDKTDSLVKALIGIFYTFVNQDELEKALSTDNCDHFKDSNGVTYKKFTVNGIVAYFNKSGNLRMIEFAGKKYYVSSKLPENVK